jgi:LysR family glycine cleavage system transcriptional activator
MIAALRSNTDRVGLVDACVVDHELLEGRLVRLFDVVATGQGAYYLVYPADGTVGEPFAAFREWLFETVAAYVTGRGA